MRDSQRGKVYKWEGYDLHHILPAMAFKTLTLEEAQALSNLAHVRYGIKYRVPRIKINNRRLGGISWNNGNIELGPDSVYSTYVLHEAAHTITDALGWYGRPHGKVFVKVYINLLSYFFKVNVAKIRKSARIKRIKLHHPDYNMPKLSDIIPYRNQLKLINPLKKLLDT